MPEHEFIIYAIGASEKLRGEFKYTLPENVIEIREVFLDAYLSEVASSGKRYYLTKEQEKTLISLLKNEEMDWEELFFLLLSKKIDSIPNFISSKNLLDLIQETCLNRYSDIPFNELFWSVRAMFIPLFSLIKKRIPEADIYHSVSTGYAGVMGGLGKYLYDKPFLLTEHGIYTREREEEIIKADWVKGHFKDVWIEYFYQLSKFAYYHSDKVISLFQKNKEIQIEIACPEEKIMLIPNGVSLEDFYHLPQKTEEDVINIGAIVRIVPIKDIKTMIQSFAVVKKVIPQTRFYVFGSYEEDYEYYEECVHLANALNLKDIYFTGEVNTKQQIGKMDILVLSSISEGQPLAILEGMACGKPFVSTDVGSCKELLYGLHDGIGQAGYIVPVMHYVEMGQAIIKLCNNPSLRLKMGINGKRRVESLYQRETFINQYKKIYEDMRFKHGRNWLSHEKSI